MAQDSEPFPAQSSTDNYRRGKSNEGTATANYSAFTLLTS